jgi:Bifunctional DNA primase/polymerase, N-terminal
MSDTDKVETNSASGNLNLAAALSYAARGWFIYPSFPGTKSRTNLKWRTASTTSEKQIRDWWTKSPNATICLDCEKTGLAVLDLDQKNGKDGRQRLDLLELENGELPLTLTQRTASGGTHLIFKGIVKSTVGAEGRALGEGIDTRGKGGMIVLAPTELPNGQYEWLNDLEPVELPEWVADLAGTIPERNEAPDAEFTPTYTQDEFAELLNLIPVEKYDGKHDLWLELLLACTHASTVEDGKEAFMAWTTRDGPGKRVGYASDYDMIAARWDYNYTKRNMDGKAVKVGTFNKHLADAGYGDKVKNPWGSTTAEEDFSEEDAAPSSGETEPKTPKVVIEAGQLPRVARKVKRILMDDAGRTDCAASDQIFRRGIDLVHLNRNRLDAGETVDKYYHVEDDLVVRVADPDWFGDRAERSINFYRVKKDQLVPCDVTVKLMRRVQSIITRWDFPPLLGTVETPTLRRDGSLLDEPGYDRASGLYYDPGRTAFPKIEARPSKQQAMEALAKLRAILVDFPFNDADDDQEGLSEAVALAMLLTAVVRRSLPTAPMFGIDAYEAQSGKTLLAQIAAIMAIGHKTAERPWSASEEERRKALGAALEAGDAVILFDNVVTPLEGAAFAGAITESMFKDRRLGSNSGADQIIAPTNSLLLATGNHLTAKGDMAEGRVLETRIVPDQELAEREYQHRDLASYVMEHRPELVAAAITVLRGFLSSPLEDRPPPTGFRHREWGDLIAASLVWLGSPDPCLAMGRTQAADPEREAQCDVVRIWAQRYGDQYVTTSQLIDLPLLTEALAGLAGVDTRKLEVKGAAAALRNMVGLARLGFKVLRVKGQAHHASRWRLENLAGEIDQELPTIDASEFADDPISEDETEPVG